MPANFISFSPDYWDGPRHNRHYFCEALGQRANVLFVSPPFNVEKVIKGWGRGALSASGTFNRAPGLVNYVPSKLLFTNHRFPRVDEWMKAERFRQIRSLAGRAGMADPILLIWHPQYREAIDRLGAKRVIYYAYDQYTGYTGHSGPTSSPAETELLGRADLVFVLSKELYKDKKPHARGRIVHLANAVDFDLFSTATSESLEVPADLAAVPQPRIGYIGTINEKVDLDIIERLASPERRWSIVLIGRQNYRRDEQRNRFMELVRRPNVHWLGHKPHDLVPAYIKGLDVCMMCYVINNWTFYGDPSKLHEYLASGKPTVGVGLSSIKEFADVVTVADSPDDWVEAVEAGLRDVTQQRVKQRIEVARGNSYEARIDAFLREVEETFGA